MNDLVDRLEVKLIVSGTPYNSYYFERVHEAIDKLPNIAPPDNDFIIKWLAEAFENPCNYGFNQQDIAEFMGENCPEWCDENCGKVSDFECWKKYFEILKSKESEK